MYLLGRWEFYVNAPTLLHHRTNQFSTRSNNSIVLFVRYFYCQINYGCLEREREREQKLIIIICYM